MTKFGRKAPKLGVNPQNRIGLSVFARVEVEYSFISVLKFGCICHCKGVFANVGVGKGE
jgi:hypothetical protein